jgi:DNA-binding beta-propeller fold protein YncE
MMEKIILQRPRAMSIDASLGLLYVASGENHWFNIMDTDTNKVIASNTQIAYPVASAVDVDTGRAYVADCHSCDNNPVMNGTSIYVLDKGSLTLQWQRLKILNLKKFSNQSTYRKDICNRN